MKKIYLFLKNGFFIMTVFMVIESPKGIAQTIPAAQPLPYVQDFSSLAHSSNIYPAGWRGWNLSKSGPVTSFRTSAPLSNLGLKASSNAGNVIGGVHNYNGKIGILARKTSSSSSSFDPTIVLAINASGQNNIKVVFDVMTIRNPYNGITQTRRNNIELQYRIGSSVGAFTSVSGSIYRNGAVKQLSGTTPQNVENVTVVLPSSCDNQPVIQLRWVQRDSSGTGIYRPSFAIDNVSVCGLPTVTASGSTSFCEGDSVILTASSGSSYLWSTGETTQSITVTSSGNYYVTVRHPLGCSNASLPVEITVFPLPVVNAGADQTIYLGYGPQSVQLAVDVTGNSPFSYLWSNAETQQSISASPTSTANYNVVVSDVNGCSASDDVMVTVIDVRCGNKNDKVLVCHISDHDSNMHAVCIDSNAVASHLSHGDYLGSCNEVARFGKKEFPEINENETKQKISVFPNPLRLNGSFSITVPADISGKVFIEMRDIFGNKYYSKIITLGENKVITVEPSMVLPSGIYVISVISNKNIYKNKLIVTK